MKILVVFGSESDATTAVPLVEALSSVHDVELAYISAHRNLEQLREKISSWQGDAIIAGAGLAAALPGVVAAMTKLPVFGIPVSSQFGGLDSLCSIAQMPPGVPVLTCAPGRSDAVAAFINGMAGRQPEKICFVGTGGTPVGIEKALAVASDLGIEVVFDTAPLPEALNIHLVADASHVSTYPAAIHVPMMKAQDAGNPEKYMTVMAWMKEGGLWVGVNNLRNAVHAAARIIQTPKSRMVYEGSVKNIYRANSEDALTFEFSDHYSIFDWGRMPDTLEGKGAALAFMAEFFFDYLQKNADIPHHALGRVGKNGIRVRRVDVIKPYSRVSGGKLVWDYAAYQKKPTNTLVPLEVIFRFGVPEGSSLLRRAQDVAYCKAIGLEHVPKQGDTFAQPIIEFSTKLENYDRYLSFSEAQEIAGLSDAEFESLKDLTIRAAQGLKTCFAGIGVDLWDGKFEFAFGPDRALMLVDSIGPDELRLIKDGVHLSKELLRQVYHGTTWHKAVAEAKKLADSRGVEDWRGICVQELGEKPGKLPEGDKVRVAGIYLALAETLSKHYLGRSSFPGAPSLDVVTQQVKVAA